MTQPIVLPRRLGAFLSILLISALAGGADSATVETTASAVVPEEVLRESISIPVRDGILLAADVFRPARDGRVSTGELPVIWALQRYHRATRRDGRIVTIIESRYPWLEEVVLAGYVAVIVDARGTGASQGVRPVELGDLDARDAHDVTEWLAAQPWSRDEIGMYGRSYRGMTQYLAAGTVPPHLRAIFPEMAMYDAFDTAYRQGVPLRMFPSWGRVIRRLDGMAGLPTDDDPEGLALEGWLERRAEENMDVAAFFERTDRRGEVDHVTGVGWGDVSPSRFADEIREADVAVHHLAGWLDTWVDDAIAWYGALDGVPQKLTIGPWSHTGREGLDFADLHLRWYERWLLGRDNGLMAEPPIRYAISDLAGRVEWKAADAWPPAGIRARTFHLAGDAGSGRGVLLEAEPDEPMTTARIADYAATTGESSRWANATGRPFDYGDMAPNDARGFVWQGEPLEERLVVTGRVMARLRVSSSAPDADLFVYLEEVDPEGVSHYVTEGMARVSSERPGSRLDEAPAEVAVRLMATSWAFSAGNRLRLSVTLADRDNALGLIFEPPPVVRVHSGLGRTSSSVELPVAIGPHAESDSTARESK